MPIFEMNVLAILGAGAIGLGFLLAYLTYRPLQKEREDYRPIYVFQVFCLLLVTIGAWMQYLSMDAGQRLDKTGIQLERFDGVEQEILSWNTVTSDERQALVASVNDIRSAIKNLAGE